MPFEVAMGVFIQFYGLDPLDMTFGRFRCLYRAIPQVQDEFRPKSKIEIDLMNREAEIEQWRREHPDES